MYARCNKYSFQRNLETQSAVIERRVLFKLKHVFCTAMSFVPTHITKVGVMQVHTWKYCGTEFDIKWHVKTHERVVHSDLKTKSVVIEHRVLFELEFVFCRAMLFVPGPFTCSTGLPD